MVGILMQRVMWLCSVTNHLHLLSVKARVRPEVKPVWKKNFFC
jgi:hypothetical protein